MPSHVMKEAPEVDFYVEWSSVVEAPTFAGTRAEMLANLQRGSDAWLREDAPHHPEQRLKRADETGTSSRWVSELNASEPKFAANGYVDEGAWDDTPMIYQQQGLLTRDNIFVLAHRKQADPDADVSDLLDPFEDDEDEDEEG